MIWAIVALLAVVLILALLLWIMWPDKAVVTGAPTPEEAKVTANAIAETQTVVERAGRQAEEIKNADRKTLFALARTRLFRMRK